MIIPEPNVNSQFYNFKRVFPFGSKSCSRLMNQCAVASKTNILPEFKRRKTAGESCGPRR